MKIEKFVFAGTRKPTRKDACAPQLTGVGVAGYSYPNCKQPTLQTGSKNDSGVWDGVGY